MLAFVVWYFLYVFSVSSTTCPAFAGRSISFSKSAYSLLCLSDLLLLSTITNSIALRGENGNLSTSLSRLSWVIAENRSKALPSWELMCSIHGERLPADFSLPTLLISPVFHLLHAFLKNLFFLLVRYAFKRIKYLNKKF